MAREVTGDALLISKFDAAVDTIKNLPKQGSFQPSNAMKLKFYSLYKQATSGPVSSARPGMFDPIGRAKWDAWKGLGEMTAEQAMQAYVDEIVSAAENMSDSPEKEKFMSIMHAKPKQQEPEVVIPDQESADDTVSTSASATPSASVDSQLDAAADAAREAPPSPAGVGGPLSNPATIAATSHGSNSQQLRSGQTTPSPIASDMDNDDNDDDDDDDDDEFCDTMESFNTDDLAGGLPQTLGNAEPSSNVVDGVTESSPYAEHALRAADSTGATTTCRSTDSGLGQASSPMYAPSPTPQTAAGGSGGAGGCNFAGTVPSSYSNAPATVGYISSQQSTMPDGQALYAPSASASAAQVKASSMSGPEYHSSSLEHSVQTLCNDVSSINARLGDIEAGMQGLKQGRPDVTTVREPRSSWWPFQGWSSSSVASLLLWPFLANYIMRVFLGRGQRRPN
ncbi:acyl-CoA-binding domain-containing protein 5-like [Sycon ciliatum]|uniref:acyl-CoA-binding domain-containing protein 5-like n=1 Tax=Sycon ciliatum TaxID=27933 RepID=UPI0031F6C401